MFKDIIKMTQAPAFSAKNPLKIAFVYDRNIADSRWVYTHELGRNSIEESFDGVVVTEKYENCDTEEAMTSAVDEAVEKGAQMIFTVFPSQMNETLKAAVKYPKVHFLNCSVNLSSNAVRTYYGRMHEAKFIMGAIAASAAENHKIGYVADYPIYGTIAGINAFALGAKMTNPRSEVYLEWSSVKGVEGATRAITDRGIHLVSSQDTAQLARGRRSSFGLSRLEGEKQLLLANPVWRWDVYYEEILRRMAITEPLLLEAIPLTLEEIFIYEMGGEDYAVRDIVL